MSVNDNGLIVIPIPYTSTISSIDQGAIIGISFAFIVGSIGFYVLGMCLIKFWFKRYYEESEESSEQQNRKRKPSSSNSDGPLDAREKRLNIQSKHNSKQPQQKKRKVYEDNPTIQQLNEQNANSTFKKFTSKRGINKEIELGEIVEQLR